MAEDVSSASESMAEFARRLGFKRSYVTQLRKEDRLVMDGRKVLVEESIARIEQTRDPSKAGVAARHAAARAVGDEPDDAPVPVPPSGTDGAGSGYQAARAVKERYLALDAKRAYEVAMGKLLDAAQVEAAAANATTLFRTSLESLPPILGVQVAGEPDEARCTALIAEAIEQALDDLARKFASLSNQKSN